MYLYIILLTIDDAFQSFYLNAWPYLKEKRIPFVLFVSTEPVGNNGYMTWDQIKEVERESFAFIGHHSHSHEHLVDKTYNQFVSDIQIASGKFLKNLGYVPSLFSYPFGEYSELMKIYQMDQHSGVME